MPYLNCGAADLKAVWLLSSTLPIAAPASATASGELCPLDAGRRHAVQPALLPITPHSACRCSAQLTVTYLTN